MPGISGIVARCSSSLVLKSVTLFLHGSSSQDVLRSENGSVLYSFGPVTNSDLIRAGNGVPFCLRTLFGVSLMPVREQSLFDNMPGLSTFPMTISYM